MSVAYLKKRKYLTVSGALVFAGVTVFVLIINFGPFNLGSGHNKFEDGYYIGELGYYSQSVNRIKTTLQQSNVSETDLQEPCPTNYTFFAQIEQRVLTSDSEFISFVSPLSVNMEVNIGRTDLIPISDTEFSIVGPIENATINSEICGLGYFKLIKQL